MVGTAKQMTQISPILLKLMASMMLGHSTRFSTGGKATPPSDFSGEDAHGCECSLFVSDDSDCVLGGVIDVVGDRLDSPGSTMTGRNALDSGGLAADAGLEPGVGHRERHVAKLPEQQPQVGDDDREPERQQVDPARIADQVHGEEDHAEADQEAEHHPAHQQGQRDA